MVLINEADSLTRDAQAALRRTMEKYSANMRLVLCANSTSRLLAPIRSRCLLVRVAAPGTEDACAVLAQVLRRAGQATADGEVLQAVAREAGGNMRKAILALEALKMQKYASPPLQRVHVADLTCLYCSPGLLEPIVVAKPDWETYCYKVGDMIVQEQSPQRVMEVRAKLYELLSHCIPATVILKVHRFFRTKAR